MAGWTNDAIVNAAARSALVPQSTPAEESSPRADGANGKTFAAQEEAEEEEIDLVEQLYGPGMSLRDEPIDLTDSLVLPAPPKNKDLDIAAWGRSPSLPATPQLNTGHNYSLSFGASPGTTPRSTSYKHTRVISGPASTSAPDQPPASSGNGRAPLSLEDYSERMRTAAVMLAQLNATLIAQPNASSQPAPPGAPDNSDTPTSGGVWSWLPGTGWIRGSVDGATSRTPLQRAEAESIRNRIMQEMMTLEEERMERMKGGDSVTSGVGTSLAKAEDEGIIRRELNKLDPSGTFLECLVESPSNAFRSDRLPGEFCCQESTDTSQFSVRSPRKLGCCFRHRQDWGGPPPRAACAHSNPSMSFRVTQRSSSRGPGIRQHLERREVPVLVAAFQVRDARQRPLALIVAQNPHHRRFLWPSTPAERPLQLC